MGRDDGGGGLNSKEVRMARMEEMDFVKEIGVYEEKDEAECWKKAGKAPISTSWVDLQKGLAVRSRWVARDFKPKGERDGEDLFAAMPPLEAKRMPFRRARERTKRPLKLLFVDVRKARLNGICEDDMHVRLPKEADACENKVGKLKRWLYGMRPAGQAWEKDCTEKFRLDSPGEGQGGQNGFLEQRHRRQVRSSW